MGVDPGAAPSAPRRTNIVLTADSDARADAVAGGAQVAASFAEAFELAEASPGGDETFVIGGASVYAQAWGAVRAVVTVLDIDVPCFDTAAPRIPDGFVLAETRPPSGWNEGSPRQRYEVWAR